ncbi:RNA polymerase sigma-70 factor (ECF subfamily) [Mucilaginibacter yixingensis]|uniref:RNA polymerase sigma-70 factor (ECF subfamily) n=1 Tax=Mucilaginibacter yixingensis TaxID=1295612 RepID=A0A2T5JAM4_9SPHI|nr:RNA polymerase sigma-70 factor [Mucilaginibacter yixingensis]PTQ97908.1 RNA polymerase sigma-70 factor (ECF subfamily) [Mucilaginibacter yixingensis]
MIAHTDEELMALVATGNRGAYSLLYTRYLNQLYRYVYLFCKSKEQSEEIVQDVFLKIWERREKLSGVESFKAYIFRTSKNLLLDHIRKQKVQVRAYDQLVPVTEESPMMADTQLIYSQYRYLIQQAINQLPQKRKMIVEMRTQEDLSLDEIADRLSISKSVVKKQLYQGMDFVRNYMHSQANILLIVIWLLLHQ